MCHFASYICVTCHTVLSVPCSLVVTSWKRVGRMALSYVMLSCVVVTFPFDIICQVWYLILWIPDFCLLPITFIKCCLKNHSVRNDQCEVGIY